MAYPAQTDLAIYPSYEDQRSLLQKVNYGVPTFLLFFIAMTTANESYPKNAEAPHGEFKWHEISANYLTI